MSSIAIGVCTAKRPMMLASCLNSLAALKLPEGYDVYILVVDNELEPNNQEIVKGLSKDYPLPIHYCHEPRKGISFARNRVLDEAMQRSADWIAFIDDDETADQDWLVALMTPDYLDTPILNGLQIMKYPKDLNVPFWARDAFEATKDDIEGRQLKNAATNNVRFSIDILQNNLRFDEFLGSMGGGDYHFFAEALRRGFKIRLTLKAITYETAHPHRYTYRGQIYRAYWFSIAHGKFQMRCDASMATVISVTAKNIRRFLGGCVSLLASPIVAPFSPKYFRRLALQGGKEWLA